MPIHGLAQVQPADGQPLLQGRRRMQPAHLPQMADLPEYPGIPDGSATNHDAIHSITVFIFQCLLRTVDIPVSKDGDLYTGVIFYFPDEGPVCPAFIKLVACPAMYGEGRDAH